MLWYDLYGKKPENYYFSSERNYAGVENDLDVILLNLFWCWLWARIYTRAKRVEVVEILKVDVLKSSSFDKYLSQS